MHARNPRAEAQEVLGDGFEARVLEPSPPAVHDGPWFADDPVSLEAAALGRPVVSPVPNADLTWDQWLATHLGPASWTADRWLGARRRLPAAPAALVETRLSLHRLAVYVLSPARRRANGKIALRWTLEGFGTPFFGADEQVRVVGTEVVRQEGDTAAVEPITSLARAAKFVLDGAPDVAWAEPFDVPPPGDPDADLPVEDTAAAFLADWYGFAWSVLEELRAQPESSDPSRVQLWPEHFDAAFDCLARERRATFGASPGDAGVPEPYLYVLPASLRNLDSELWNATTFRGAILPFSGFVNAADQRAAALDFFLTRLAALAC
ncbi:MAG TPA: hypothetical protein VHF24_11345 [Acidimicrobiales bacterium]|nr:hypothetical protein [Acidimicrobiales bacterium]